MFVPFDDECRFTEEGGEFFSYFVRDADQKVIDELNRSRRDRSDRKTYYI